MGASRLHSPSHAAFSTSVKLSKSNPRAFSRSVMPCVNPVKVLLICSQMAMILLLNSSLVFQRCTKAATKAATAAIMASSGPSDTPNAPVIAPMPPCTVEKRAGSLDTAEKTVPTLEMVFPSTTSIGPRAAATSAIFAMVSLVCGSNWFSLSTSS